ncbi:MAG: hypothetical protein H6618_09425 [Deltaproteobacteria bacterium]|nr:hypothetical protein [Deltaproteobacteria bacterium]
MKESEQQRHKKKSRQERVRLANISGKPENGFREDAHDEVSTHQKEKTGNNQPHGSDQACPDICASRGGEDATRAAASAAGTGRAGSSGLEATQYSPNKNKGPSGPDLPPSGGSRPLKVIIFRKYAAANFFGCAGFEVYPAETPEQFFHYLNSIGQPDAVVSGQVLPSGFDPINVVLHTKSRYPEAFVFVISALDFSEDFRNEFCLCGGDHLYMETPCNIKQIPEIIKEHITHQTPCRPRLNKKQMKEITGEKAEWASAFWLNWGPFLAVMGFSVLLVIIVLLVIRCWLCVR